MVLLANEEDDLGVFDHLFIKAEAAGLNLAPIWVLSLTVHSALDIWVTERESIMRPHPAI